MVASEVMDLTVVARSFPETPLKEIIRENILHTLDKVFQGDTRILFIEGSETVGKTTLLSQFARRHPHHAISLFIHPTSHYAYQPDSVRYDLCSQIWWAIHQTVLPDDEIVDAAFLRKLISDLQGHIRRKKGEIFYFVVDGLAQTPKDAEHNKKAILEMLPIGLPSFRFLFSGEPSSVFPDMDARLQRAVKSHLLSVFIFEETKRYFEDFNLDQSTLIEVQRVSNGNPGHLASIRRELESGKDERTLIEELADTLTGQLELEWRRVREARPEQLLLLAIIAHDRRSHALDDLAHLVGLSTQDAQDFISNLRFVIIDGTTQEVTYDGETFRKFAAKKLQHLETEANLCVLENLRKDPQSKEALTYLPVYLEDMHRPAELLEYLSADNLGRMLDHNQTLAPAQQTALRGVRAAESLRRDAELLRLSLHSATFTEIASPEILRSEIEARMALRDYDGAMMLALTTALKEDRLQMLAVIARLRRDQGLPPLPEITEHIQALYNEINFSALSGRVIEIASDLIHSLPDLAVDLVEKANTVDTSEQALDWAFAVLSLVALSSDVEQALDASVFEDIRSRVKNPDIRTFITTTQYLLRGYSAPEIIEVTNNQTNVRTRLFFLRLWTRVNRRRPDAAKVVEHALDLAIRTTEYAPNAGMLRELMAPLPFVGDVEKLGELVGLFDAQKATVETLGPTEEYVRMQLLLAEAEGRFDPQAAHDRLIDIYLYITYKVDDLAVKSASMARLMVTLDQIDPQLKFEEKDQLHSLSQNDLDTNLANLLKDTALHYEATRSVIVALAQSRPDTALKWAQQLNTEAQRDASLFDLVDAAVQAPPDEVNLAFVNDTLSHFAVTEVRDAALLKVLEHLPTLPDDPARIIQDALPLIERIPQIQDAEERCRACSLAYTFIMDNDPAASPDLAGTLLSQIKDTCQVMDVSWSKVNVAFRVAEAISSTDPVTAREYVAAGEQYRDDAALSARNNVSAYLVSLRLAIRAYSGLLAKNMQNESDRRRIGVLINRIPSLGERAKLWAELALRCYAKGKIDECRKIAADHIRPLLYKISPADARYRYEVIAAVAPALYCAHAPTAIETIESMLPKAPEPYRDEAYSQICRFLCTKRPPSDPYEVLPEQSFVMTIDEISDVCDLLTLMDRDWLIHMYMEPVVNTVTNGRNNTVYSKGQRAQIATKLQKVVDHKLPNARHTRHEGYKIAAQALVVKLRDASMPEWEKLVQEAKAIPNVADQAYVLALIASAMPSKHTTQRKAIFDDAKSVADQIPYDYDRMYRYQQIGYMASHAYDSVFRECFTAAMNLCLGTSNRNAVREQRRLVDLAYMVDPTFAASLASLVDDDPARADAKLMVNRQLQVHDLKKRMLGESKKGSEKAGTASADDYSAAGGLLLAGINAGRIEGMHHEKMREYIRIASTLPLERAEPILSWVLENDIRRFENNPQQVQDTLRPLFESCLAGAELAHSMTTKFSQRIIQGVRQVSTLTESSRVIIEEGEQDKATTFIREWLTQHLGTFLVVHDPYFGIFESVELLKMVLAVMPSCQVRILTGAEHHERTKLPKPWEDEYRREWTVHSAQEPPNTEIIIMGTRSGGVPPIHDRWILTDNAGLRLGTSYNGLGRKTSEITMLGEADVEETLVVLEPYLKRTIRDHKGDRLQFTTFTL